MKRILSEKKPFRIFCLFYTSLSIKRTEHNLQIPEKLYIFHLQLHYAMLPYQNIYLKMIRNNTMLKM